MRRAYAFIFLCLVACGLCAEESGGPRKPRLIVGTNLAYLSLSALSTNADSIFLIVPLEAQLPMNARFSLLPSLTFIYFSKASSLSGGAMDKARYFDRETELSILPVKFDEQAE